MKDYRDEKKEDLLPKLNEEEIDNIIDFLHSLTDKDGNNRPLGRPHTVPSGLPVD